MRGKRVVLNERKRLKMQNAKRYALQLLLATLLCLTLQLTGCCLLTVCLQREQPQIVLDSNTVQIVQPKESVIFSEQKLCFGNEAAAKLLELAKKGKDCKQWVRRISNMKKTNCKRTSFGTLITSVIAECQKLAANRVANLDVEF
jgi:hypothetical protein